MGSGLSGCFSKQYKVSTFDFLPADLMAMSSEDTFDIFSAICTPAGSMVPIAEFKVPLLTVEDVAGFPFCTSSIRFLFHYAKLNDKKCFDMCIVYWNKS